MKKLLALALLVAVCAGPASALNPKLKITHHHHISYRYKAPKSYKMHIHKQRQKQGHPA
ncbi:MAG: hypothetical protein ABR928_20490 [Terracidiphilus sp.]|jgi:hypothetical protein